MTGSLSLSGTVDLTGALSLKVKSGKKKKKVLEITSTLLKCFVCCSCRQKSYFSGVSLQTTVLLKRGTKCHRANRLDNRSNTHSASLSPQNMTLIQKTYLHHRLLQRICLQTIPLLLSCVLFFFYYKEVETEEDGATRL